MTATIKDIAREAHVSPATVSRVLAGKTDFYSSATAKKVHLAANKLAYNRNISAVELVTRQSDVIAVIVSNVHTNFAGEIIRGIQDHARPHHLNVIVQYIDATDKKQQRQALQIAIERSVRGILLVAIDLNQTNSQLLVSTGIPTLYLSINPKQKLFPYITSNDYQIGYQATSYLINHGHQRIGLAATDLDSVMGKLRLQGYQDALKEHHLAINHQWVTRGNFTYEDGVAAMRLFEDSHLSAAIAASDFAAVGMLNQAQNMNIPVPKSFAIMSIDGTQLCEIVRPKLTSISQSFYEMGVKGLEAIIQPDPVVETGYTPIRLVERGSC